MAGSVVVEAAKQSAGLARQVLGKITDKTLHREKVLVAVKVLANETTIDPFAFIEDELGADLKNLTVDSGLGIVYGWGLAHTRRSGRGGHRELGSQFTRGKQETGPGGRAAALEFIG